MKYQITQQLKNQFMDLTKQILSDYMASKYPKLTIEGHDSKTDGNLLESMFTRRDDADLTGRFQYSEAERNRELESIFPYQKRGTSQINDYENREDQIVFLTEIRRCLMQQTNKMEEDEIKNFLPDLRKSGENYELHYSEAKTNLLYRTVMMPALHAIEAASIKRIEDNAKKEENVYQELGNKILLLGTSGEYDQVITFDQIRTIMASLSAEDKTADIIAKIRAVLGSNVHITSDARVIPFNTEHFKGGFALPNGQMAFEFTQLSRVMDQRLGTKLVHQMHLASGGAIKPYAGAASMEFPAAGGLRSSIFQIDDFLPDNIAAETESASSKNITFIVEDSRVEDGPHRFMVTVDLAKIREEEGCEYSIRPEKKETTNQDPSFYNLTPDLRIPEENISDTEDSNLWELYQQEQQPKEGEVLHQLGGKIKLAPDLTPPANEVPIQTELNFTGIPIRTPKSSTRNEIKIPKGTKLSATPKPKIKKQKKTADQNQVTPPSAQQPTRAEIEKYRQQRLQQAQQAKMLERQKEEKAKAEQQQQQSRKKNKSLARQISNAMFYSTLAGGGGVAVTSVLPNIVQYFT